MMSPAVAERLAKLDEIRLDHGGHDSFDEGHCSTELVSWLADEPFSASPKCLSPVLRYFLQRLNDGLPDDKRQLLKPYLPRTIGTAGDGQDEARARLAADWVIHTALPGWLELAGANETAAELREASRRAMTRLLPGTRPGRRDDDAPPQIPRNLRLRPIQLPPIRNIKGDLPPEFNEERSGS